MVDLTNFFRKKLIPYLVNLDFYKKKNQYKSKSKIKFDPVTPLDLKIENDLKTIILKNYPNSSFVGEETKKKINNSILTWVIDPIDGTKNLILGSPVWSNLIGLIINNEPKYGLAFFPVLKKYYFSDSKNSFVFENFKKKIKISSSKTNNLSKSKIVTNTIHTLNNKELFNFFLKHKFLFKVSSMDSYNYCLLAEGKIDIIIEAGVKFVDIMPLVPIIRNSGGVISNWHGEKVLSSGNIVVSSNKRLHSIIVSILKKIL